MKETIEQKAARRCTKLARQGLRVNFYTVVQMIEKEREIKKEQPDLPKAERRRSARLYVMGHQTSGIRKAALEHT